MFRRLIVLSLLIIQVGLVAAGARLAWESRSSLGEDAGLALVENLAWTPNASLESGLALAQEAARRSSAGARLVLVSQQVDWPPDPPVAGEPGVAPGGWLTYVFALDGNTRSDAALSLEIERLSGTIVRTEELTWEEGSERPTLPLGRLPISSDEAILAVEEAGGTAFRAECPAARGQTIITLNLNSAADASTVEAASPIAVGTPVSQSPGTPVSGSSGTQPAGVPREGLMGTATWVVTYADRGANDNVALIATVDAVTGEVLAIETDLAPDADPCGSDA
ncbi:MAG TPA: hypothetical protein VGR16_14160 [Thermomicrobiales bacterium]|nr:hypothetical protein [Thermomicrobiales bacterium]